MRFECAIFFEVAAQVKALMEHMEQQRLLELLSKLVPAAALSACCFRLLLPPLTQPFSAELSWRSLLRSKRSRCLNHLERQPFKTVCGL